MPPLVQAAPVRSATRSAAVVALSVGLAALAAGVAGGAAGVPGLAAPVTASAFIVFAQPGVPAARPRALIAGHAICLTLGLLAASSGLPPFAAIAAASAVAAFAMLALRVLHAPAIAHVIALQFAGDRMLAFCLAVSGLILGLAAVQFLVRKHPIEGNAS